LSKSGLSSAKSIVETYILVLEQLGNTKEKGGSFLGGERLACVQQVDNPGQESPTFPRRDGGFIECPSFLDDRGFVVVERC